jgi:predicted nucleotidyltransferase
MLDSLITSKTRLKLLLKFFLNSNTTSYLRDLEEEFGESTNAIRIELNRFENAGMLQSEVSGNKKIFKANTGHPLFSDLHNILLKYTGIDQIIEKVISRLGGVEQAYVTGRLARGTDSPVVDICIVGTGIDRMYLTNLVDKTEKLLKRKIRHIVIEPEEAVTFLQSYPEALLLWKNEQ